MDTIKQLTTEAMQEVEDLNYADAISLLVDAIEDLTATVNSLRERNVTVAYYEADFGGAEVIN